MNGALMLRFEKLGRHMGLADDKLSGWMGYTQTSIYLSKYRKDKGILTAQATDFVVSILTEEALALNIFSGSPYLNDLNRGSKETLQGIAQGLAHRAIPYQCDNCSHVGCRGLRCTVFKTSKRRPQYRSSYQTCGSEAHLDNECNKVARAFPVFVNYCAHCRRGSHLHLQCWLAFPSKRPLPMQAKDVHIGFCSAADQNALRPRYTIFLEESLRVHKVPYLFGSSVKVQPSTSKISRQLKRVVARFS